MTTYYVDATLGDDARSAVEAQVISTPWKTLAKAGQQATSAGDIIDLRAGVYNDLGGINTYFRFYGIDVIVQGHADEVAIIECPVSATGYLFFIGGKATFNNVTIRHSATADASSPAISIARISPGRSLYFNNCIIDWRLSANVSVFQPYTASSADTIHEFNGCEIRHNRQGNFSLANGAGEGAYYARVRLTGSDIYANKLMFSTGNADLSMSGCNYYTQNANNTFYDLGNGSKIVIKDNTLDVVSDFRLWLPTEEMCTDVISRPDDFVFDGNVVYCSEDEPFSTTSGTLNYIDFMGAGASGYHFPPSGYNFYFAPGSVAADFALAYRDVASRRLSGVVGLGDSITRGTASSAEHAWHDVFNAEYGAGSIVVDNYTALGGLRIPGAIYQLDRAIVEHLPEYVIAFFGVNNLNDMYSLQNAEQAASAIIVVLEKIKRWGATPIWLGCPSIAGGELNVSAPDNSVVAATNELVKVWCSNNGIVYRDILTTMQESRSDWFHAGVYYANIVSDLHPNDAGHAIIGSLAIDAYADAIAAKRPLPSGSAYYRKDGDGETGWKLADNRQFQAEDSTQYDICCISQSSIATKTWTAG